MDYIYATIMSGTTKETRKRAIGQLYACEDPKCDMTFLNQNKKRCHSKSGLHSYSRKSMDDKVRDLYQQKVNISIETKELQQKESMEVIESSTCTTSYMGKGWALKEEFARRGGRFNAKQLHFLNRTFQDGTLNSSAKSSPTTAAKMMRSLECPVTGDKVFQPEEWLKESQIKSFFSRCYTAQKKSGAAPTVVETSCVCDRCRSGPGLETETDEYTAELEPEVNKTHVDIMHYTTYRHTSFTFFQLKLLFYTDTVGINFY